MMLQRAQELGEAHQANVRHIKSKPASTPSSKNETSLRERPLFGQLSSGTKAAIKEMDNWSLILSYFKTFGHSRHQIEGYERFCDELMPQIIRENSKLMFYGKQRHHTVEFRDVYIMKPTVHDLVQKVRPMYPHEARVRSATYSVDVCVNIVHTQRDFTPEEESRRNQKRIKLGAASAHHNMPPLHKNKIKPKPRPPKKGNVSMHHTL